MHIIIFHEPYLETCLGKPLRDLSQADGARPSTRPPGSPPPSLRTHTLGPSLPATRAGQSHHFVVGVDKQKTIPHRVGILHILRPQ
jgi:hypothetical protein